jgi:hypothetical protein
MRDYNLGYHVAIDFVKLFVHIALLLYGFWAFQFIFSVYIVPNACSQAHTQNYSMFQN